MLESHPVFALGIQVSDFGYVKFNELQRHVKFLETEFAKIEDPSTADNKDDLKEEVCFRAYVTRIGCC